MATSDRRDTPVALPGDRYDVLLAAIPLALAGGALAALAAGLPLRDGVAAGSVLAALAVGDALFKSPPRGPRRRDGSPNS